MKQCDYCGRQTADDTSHCTECGTEYPLISAGAAATPPPLPELIQPTQSRAIRFSGDIQVCAMELGLVLFVGFAPALVQTIYVLAGAVSAYDSPTGAGKWIYMLLHELGALAVLEYVLFRKGSSFRDLGLRWTWANVVLSIPIAVAAYLAFCFAYYPIALFGSTNWHVYGRSMEVARQVFDPNISVLALIALFANGFFEELIVRGFLMTEVKELTKSTTLAIACSVLFQATYHLYQGVPLAAADMGTFLVFSIFYAKTNRILPVALAHSLIDIAAMAIYVLRTAGHAG